jgi:hypothetical protein
MMPGPFPGMDPFLEAPLYFHGFHNRLIFCVSEILNGSMPQGFIANIEERIYVEEENRSIFPDVTVTYIPHNGGGTATLERAAPTGRLAAYPLEMHEWFIQIRTTHPERRLITVIEILSPANKARGEGQREYRQKQQEILRSDVNLLEIDLLRQGEHIVAAPFNGLRERGEWDYLACLHRGARRYNYDFWMIRLRERLPYIWVPLTQEQEDIELDLQAVFDRAYESGRYLQAIDYRSDPTPPPNAEDTAWMNDLLREKGLRTA